MHTPPDGCFTANIASILPLRQCIKHICEVWRCLPIALAMALMLGLLQATQERIKRINRVFSSLLNDDVRDYLRVLGMLIYECEVQTEVFPKLTSEERVQALIEDLEDR